MKAEHLTKQALPFGFGTKKDRGTGFSVLATREMKRHFSRGL